MASQIRHKYLTRACKVSIINAGFGGAQPKAGIENAPTALLNSGLGELISNAGRTLVPQTQSASYTSLKPQGDRPYRRMNDPRWVSAATKSICEQVYGAAKSGHQVLTLGGDHSVAIGTLTGLMRAMHERFDSKQEMGIIYVDAHADLNVPEDSESGNIHGMALAFAAGLASSNEPAIFDWIKSTDTISLEKLVYIGLRDVDESEKNTIGTRQIRSFWMDDVRQVGIEEVMRQTLEYLGDVPIHVSYDIDSLDPFFAPSTGLPVPGGLSLDEAIFIMKMVNDSGRLIAMDLVELNPGIGSERDVSKTIESAFAVIKAGLGIPEEEAHG